MSQDNNKQVMAPVAQSETEAENKETISTDGATATLLEVFSNADAFDICLMIVGTLGGIATGLAFPAFNILFGRMINTLNGGDQNFADAVAELCIYFVIIACIMLVSGSLQVYCWAYTGERQTQKFREKYVNAILSQEIGWFDTCGAGELATRVAEICGKVQDGIGRKVGDSIQYLTQIIGSYAVAFYLSWRLAIVLIAAFPAIAGAGAYMINAVTAAQNQTLGQYAAAGGLATEALGAIRTVTALNAQPDAITRYRVYLFTAMQVGIKKGFKVGLGNGGLFCVCFFTYALGFWYGGELVADSVEGSGDMNGGKVLSVFFCTIMGSMALGQLAPPMTSFIAAKAAVRSLLDVVHRKPLIDGLSKEGLQPEIKTQGAIEIRNINFAYPSRPNIVVCRDYNLSIAPGESVALVGASGCGKSTIINLLLRFYDPQSGSINLDGFDIKELNIRWLRHQIGYVGQEPILFAGSVADNIAYGLPPEMLGEASELNASGFQKLSKEGIRERVVAAAKLANAHDFISAFPQGYDTDVGSSGSAMSGGQKQRIAIARALIKKPAVLLLDEATSALDTVSERVVQESIDALQRMKAQTTIIIAHRLSTIRNADKICLINQGQIAEMGTHDELIARNGLYADLVSLQMTGDDEEEEAVQEEVAETLAAEAEGTIPGPPGSSPPLASERKRTGSQASLPGSAPPSAQLASGADVGSAGSKQTAPPAPELSKEESQKVSSRIWGMVWQHSTWLILACLGASVFGGVFPSWGLMLAHSQNAFFYDDPDKIREESTLYAYLYIMLGVVALFSATFQFWGVAQVAERVSINLRSQMFEAIMRREISFFDYEENSIGTLTTRLSDDSRVVNKAFGESLARQLQAFFTLAVGIILGFRASWKISLVVIAAFPVNIIASAIQMQAIAGQQYEEDKVGGAVNLHGGNAKKADSAGKAGAGKGSKEGTSGGVVSGGHGAVISTAFTHMRTVSAFSMQHKVSDHYAKLTRDIAEDRAQRAIIGGIGFGGAQCSLFLTYALLFWYGSTLIENGEITFLQLMSSILCLMLGALGLGTALADLGDQKLGIQTADRIFKSIDDGAASSIDGLSITGQVPPARTEGRIVLKNVNFRYPTRPDVQVCKNLNLVIEPGEMVAFVGPSGSGKSTIINLLLRFYDPLSGTVTLDGVNIKDLNVRWLRSQIGYVGQEPVLFQGTVEENIAKGRVGAIDQPVMPLGEAMKLSDDSAVGYFDECTGCFVKKSHDVVPANEPLPPADLVAAMGADDIEMGAVKRTSGEPAQDVVEAAIASNAHDFIKTFPKGYDTDIGEGSIMVSGGQKQRIAIARALIKKPTILLLDEATSALDATSERIVQESIDALQRNKAQTCIVIAHRLSTIRSADKIVVIDKGAVVEIGKHDDLVAKGGLYATLWAKQAGTTPARNSPAPK